jgi:hypothetical protein
MNHSRATHSSLRAASSLLVQYASAYTVKMDPDEKRKAYKEDPNGNLNLSGLGFRGSYKGRIIPAKMVSYAEQDAIPSAAAT